MTRARFDAIAIVVAAFLASACKRSKEAPAPTPITPDPSTSAQPDAAPKPDDTVDFGEPGPLVVTPSYLPLPGGGNWSCSRVTGWASDGTTLGVCERNPLATRCWLLGRDGTTDAFDDDAGGSGFVDTKKSVVLEARLKTLDLKATPTARWRYARDVEVTWTVVPGASTGPATSALLRIGARVHGGPTSWIDTMSVTTLAGPFYEIHPEIVALSPDGASLGVVAHAVCSEFCARYPMHTYDVNAIAAHAYNDAGFARHQKEDWSGAADLFHEATAADPSFDLAHYNLACAYARLGDARAERELKKAIELGDAAEVKKKATADADFSSVKTQAWFVALTK